jgi:hypothetical protein
VLQVLWRSAAAADQGPGVHPSGPWSRRVALGLPRLAERTRGSGTASCQPRARRGWKGREVGGIGLFSERPTRQHVHRAFPTTGIAWRSRCGSELITDRFDGEDVRKEGADSSNEAKISSSGQSRLSTIISQRLINKHRTRTFLAPRGHRRAPPLLPDVHVVPPVGSIRPAGGKKKRCSGSQRPIKARRSQMSQRCSSHPIASCANQPCSGVRDPLQQGPARVHKCGIDARRAAATRDGDGGGSS